MRGGAYTVSGYEAMGVCLCVCRRGRGRRED